MAGLTAPLLLSFLCLSVLVRRSLEASVPAVFIFGDSTADVGNNNFLPLSKARADFPPNGLDFVASRPTGRFSNGLNSADFLAKMLGFRRSPPPFLSLMTTTALIEQALCRGVNFASAGSGILESSGIIYGQFISMEKQLHYFEMVRENLTAYMGTTKTDEHLSKSMFLITTGSNDIFQSFALDGPLNHTHKVAFIGTLAFTYRAQLKKLYNLGARKIGIISTPPIGCCPSQRRLTASGECSEDLNQSSRMLYQATQAILGELSSEYKDFKYSLGNSYEMVTNFFKNPLPFGFTELKSACCGSGKFNGEGGCIPNSTFCSNRSQYLFWDLFHPTQAACKLAAQTLFLGSQEFVTPINFGQLAAC